MKKIVCLLLVMGSPLLADWELLDSGVADNLYGTQVISSESAYVVGWGASSGALALRTTDGGASWNETLLANGAFVFSVTHIDANHIYAAGCLNGGQYGAVFKTANGGESWSHSTMSTTYGLYDVEFTNASTGYACGWLGKIYKTTNGGDSWTPLSSGTGNVLRWMNFPSETTGYIVGGPNWDSPNTLYKTTNSGAAWSNTHSFGGAVIGGIHFFDETTGIACGGQSGERIYKTTDGGANWTIKHSSTTGLLQAITFDATGTGYVCGNLGHVLKSEDFGETWQAMDSVLPSTTLLSISASDGIIITAGTSGNIFSYSEGLQGSRGDLNQDEQINVSDIILLVNIILDRFQASIYQLWAADLNEDDIINIADVVSLVNLIL